MTVITMPSSEKKSDNVPLVSNIEVDPSSLEKDLEAGNNENDRPVRSKFLVFRVINDRVYSLWALIYILLMSLFIIFMMLYGEHIYRAIGNAFNNENDAFYGTGTISLNDNMALPLQDLSSDYEISPVNEMELKKLEDFALNMDKINNQMMNQDDVISEFKEDFEFDLKDDSYEKIVPNLPLTNSARFIHDFSSNVTGIVDVDGRRCFVMPLNRSSVLPPKSLYDLLFKMSSGYYAVDTRNVMHNMRIVEPPVKDLTQYGLYIAKDCAGFPTFKLEKIVTGVYKRSAPTSTKTFSAFSGQMDLFRIVNYHDLDSQ